MHCFEGVTNGHMSRQQNEKKKIFLISISQYMRKTTINLALKQCKNIILKQISLL